MELTHGKLSNYTGQAKDNEKLHDYLSSVDKDLQDLWWVIHYISPLVGSAKASLASNSTIGFSYIPLINPAPTLTPTNYAGKTAMVFCNSNSSLYIFNTSDTAWKVEELS